MIELVAALALAGGSYALGAYHTRRRSEIGDPGAAWQHLARGTTYFEVCRGMLQNASGKQFQEGDRLVAYQGRDRKVWYRWEPEFEDGRFRRLD